MKATAPSMLSPFKAGKGLVCTGTAFCAVSFHQEIKGLLTMTSLSEPGPGRVPFRREAGKAEDDLTAEVGTGVLTGKEYAHLEARDVCVPRVKSQFSLLRASGINFGLPGLAIK